MGEGRKGWGRKRGTEKLYSKNDKPHLHSAHSCFSPSPFYYQFMIKFSVFKLMTTFTKNNCPLELLLHFICYHQIDSPLSESVCSALCTAQGRALRFSLAPLLQSWTLMFSLFYHLSYFIPSSWKQTFSTVS